MTASLTERLVTKLSGAGGRTRASRRSFLGGAAVVGAALAVDPWGYLTRPQSAYASACGTGASCSSGWTVMCCTINDGKNTCPPNTYAGGWWKADKSSYCGGAARYYIDCNAVPGHHFACRCNNTSCDHRYVACNNFRYGQCNTQVEGVTPVVCRQISCTPPWELYPHGCGRSSATDNNTAGHTAPCLTAANTYPIRPIVNPQLRAGARLQSGERLTSSDGLTFCEMLSNGNLAIYNDGHLLWSSGTTRLAPGGHAYMQPGGSLVIIDKAGHAVWSTRTKAPTGTARAIMRADGTLVIYDGAKVLWSTHTRLWPEAPAQLQPGQRLQPSRQLTSTDRLTTCIMQPNGDLGVYNGSGLLWSSKTSSLAPGGHAYMQPGGSLVIIDKAGHAVWSTHTTSSTGHARLIMRADGNLVIYDGVKVLWGTRTHTP